MSHFTVLVIGEDVEEQLAPYQENNMGDCPGKYLTFTPVEAEELEHYQVEFEKDPDWQKTFSDYMEHQGYEKHMGDFGYWSNENARWDWYQVGGRWTGMFKLKLYESLPADELEYITVGDPGLMTGPAQQGFADSCLKSHIDIAGMRQAAADETSAKYDAFEEASKGLDLSEYLPWATVHDQYPDDVDTARQVYHAQPLVVKTKAAGISPFSELADVYKIGKGGRAAAIKDAEEICLQTFAVLMDGKWYERGSMGWFGCVSNESDSWGEEFAKLFDSLPDDTLLTVVDCHI